MEQAQAAAFRLTPMFARPTARRHFALHDKLLHPGVPLNARLLIMAVLVTVWGTRLTYNFARKGGYRFSAEDYRWGSELAL